MLEFFDLVWGRKECYVDLPSKANGHWIPANIEWPAQRGMVRRRIESCLEDDEDVYFSVARFRSKGRRIADVLPTHWLWADLDRVDPVFLDEDNVLPTLAWESSPGRYQCLWKLRHSLRPEQQTRLNRALSHAIGADKGGWDLTQVLRPPGTVNHKYSPPANVELLWYDADIVYEPAALVRAVRAIDPSETHDGQATAAKITEGVVSLDKLPARARRLLGTPQDQVVVGERSSKLWELECLLLEHGLDEETVFSLVEGTAWNKHKEVGNSERRLREEIGRAAKRVASRVPKSTADSVRRRDDDDIGGTEGDAEPGEQPASVRVRPSPFVEYANFLSATIETPRWLIHDIWSSASHGIIGGEPKTSKSTFAMAMAMSVASGRPFMGKYEVSSPGPVLMIQEENAPWVVQDRLRKIAYSYGLIRKSDIEISEGRPGAIANTVRLDFPDEAPLYMLNNYGFDLDDEEDRDLLVEEIRRVGAAMVILDPLYLMVGDKNINHAHEVTPLMQWLMALRYNWDCAVVLVHHWSKSPSGGADGRRSGQRLMGSGLLHGWVESAVYMEALDGAGGAGGAGGGERGGVGLRVRAEREFRNVSPRVPLEIEWRMGEPGELELEVDVKEMGGEARRADLLDAVVEAGPEGLTLNALSTMLGLDKKQLYAEAVRAGCEIEERIRGKGTSYLIKLPAAANGATNG